MFNIDRVYITATKLAFNMIFLACLLICMPLLSYIPPSIVVDNALLQGHSKKRWFTLLGSALHSTHVVVTGIFHFNYSFFSPQSALHLQPKYKCVFGFSTVMTPQVLQGPHLLTLYVYAFEIKNFSPWISFSVSPKVCQYFLICLIFVHIYPKIPISFAGYDC